jgi:hypothetical protein
MHSIHRLLGNSANSSDSESCFMWSRRRLRSTNHSALAKPACALFLVSTVSLAQRDQMTTQTGMHSGLVSLFRHESRRGDSKVRVDIKSFPILRRRLRVDRAFCE